MLPRGEKPVVSPGAKQCADWGKITMSQENNYFIFSILIQTSHPRQ